MDLVAIRVARRFLAGKRLANSLPDYIRMVAEDGAKVVKWKQSFLTESQRSIKAAHAHVVQHYQHEPGMDPKRLAAIVKDCNNILSKAEAALHKLHQEFTQKNGYALSHAYYEEHYQYWDPEMFADGQTKADYGGPKPIDTLFAACEAAYGKYMEFWRRFEAKWDLGSMNVTLDSFLPAEHHEAAHVNIEFLHDYNKKGLDVAFKDYETQLQKIAREIPAAPPGGSAHTPGVALSALLGEAEKAGDTWTKDFARSLMRQLDARRPFTDKQRGILETKLHQYGVPAPNYSLRW